ncbi:MAG: transporter [Pseudomonadota bacterium]
MNDLMRACAASLLICATAQADTRPDDHAPLGVMGDHTHAQGEWMFSYRYMQMNMAGNRDGTSDLSPETIATTVPNRFANPPMMPPTLRVVPTEMTMEMHMLGAMYAPSDAVTLMAMTHYITKDMDHVTFAGPAGDTRLGTFTTRASGLGDTSLSALIRLGGDTHSRFHATLGVSAPTGSIDETDEVLTPMNTRPTLRLPYPMQLGSGTWDLITGLTTSSSHDGWGWGAQWRSVIRTGENSKGYTFGDEHSATGWLSWQLSPTVSLSGRLAYHDRGDVDGIDARIMAPVQTADPDNYGLRRLDASFGANWLVGDNGHRLAIEVGVPAWQDLNGPQLETDWTVVLGWQFAP